ncbi:MAG: DoxX family protein [Chloroflexi bacterium]|nr:DoxX family protein [Chloroflexota bacterium]
MNIVLWVVQGLLAIVFLMAGGMKLIRSRQDIIDSGQDWAEHYQEGFIKAIGVAEVLGAVGLVVPALTGILPVLTPLAAAGLVVIMIGAAVVHIRRSEVVPFAIMNSVLGLAAAFIAVGRFVLVPVL